MTSAPLRPHWNSMQCNINKVVQISRSTKLPWFALVTPSGPEGLSPELSGLR
ncbi:unnamed protein product, partial [Nesidiocoris tenuis]